MQTGAPLYNKDKISRIAKKNPKKPALPTWKNLDGWTLNKQFFLFGLIDEIDTHQNTPETMLIHTGTNDLENNTDPKAMAQEIYRILALTSSKFPNSRILYSTLLPRDDGSETIT